MSDISKFRVFKNMIQNSQDITKIWQQLKLMKSAPLAWTANNLTFQTLDVSFQPYI